MRDMMKERLFSPAILVNPALGLLACLGLYATSVYNYLLFHTIGETFAIVVACGMFMVAWNSRRFFENNYLLFLGIAYLFVASLDFAHTIAYHGMGIFGGDEANYATQLWVSARYLEAVSLLLAPLFLSRGLNVPVATAAYGGAIVVILISVILHIFPDCFVAGSGLSTFKKISEYLICLMLIVAGGLLVRSRHHFDGRVFRYVLLSIVCTVLSELFFTFYLSVYDLANFLGHVLKILSFFLIYKALVETGLARPYDLLFRNLKQSEDSLKQQREWLRVTLSSIGEGLIATDRTGKIAFMNRIAGTITGWKQRDAIGQPLDAVFRTLGDGQSNPDFLERLLKEKQPFLLGDDPLLYARDGRQIPIEHNAATITTENGDTSGVVVVFHDVTEKRRNEEALRRVNEQLEAKVRERTATLQRQADLLDLTHDAIFVRDAEGYITFWNQGATEMYGWSATEAMGRRSSDLLKSSYPLPLEEIESQVLAVGRWDGELVHTRKDGGRLTVASRWALDKDEAGRVRILEINIDITEQKNAERNLLQSQKQEALGVLAGGIAHDFNNMLAAILGFTEMIMDRVTEGSREHRYATRIMSAATRGRDLVRQMLTFSRRTDEEKRPLELPSIVKETIKLLRASIPATVDINLDVSVGEGSLVLGDPIQIEQVLMNLCTNAAYSMREKGGTLSVKLSRDVVSPSEAAVHGVKAGPYVKLVVSDTGAGIPSAILDRIYDPFFTTKSVGEGTGLGLSVVLGIVKAFQGFVVVQSEEGKGSSFTVCFPEIAGKTKPGTALRKEDIPTGHEKILFVDDEESVVEASEEILGSLGYRLISATDSRKALELFERDPAGFDLIITDQTMPRLAGLELASRILSIRPDCPIILCTGFSYLVSEESAKAAGVRALVMKPLTKREIAKTIRQVLDGQPTRTNAEIL